MITLADIQAHATRDYEALKERKRRRYRFARDLGFNSKEAKLLSGYSEARIMQLARERLASGVG